MAITLSDYTSELHACPTAPYSLVGYPSTAPISYATTEQMAQIHHILIHDVGGHLDYIEGRVSNVREQIASLEGRIQSLTEVLYSLLASFKELKR